MGGRRADTSRGHVGDLIVRTSGAYIAVGDCSDWLAEPIAVNCEGFGISIVQLRGRESSWVS